MTHWRPFVWINRSLTRRLIFILVLALGGVTTLVACAYYYFITFHPDAGRYPVRGIDVSHHQGAIDWPKVATSGIAFAYIKATEGGDFSDRRFRQNWRGAAAAGLRRGAYHFFTFCRPGIEQAAHFIRTVPADPDMLPPAVDLEFGGNCSVSASRLNPDRELPAFLEAVEAHYGHRALLYATREFYQAHMASKNIVNPLWLRSILFEPDYNRHPWTLWQYHNRGRVAGVQGPVDYNVFAGSMQDFERPW
ncbi:GH25 family lysozyme [Pelagibius sp. Alg239-R121]|uniref:glycoside hydrolase family 25 protein n=1 Tax=Pelagibius sp. Alg239-R121 TaxID=2993448 RepID=UPI0024A77AE8|nr:GH25 family lysozyme [Pelagibius sp. Alg239-R121]